MQAPATLGRLFPSAYLVVVQAVILTMRHRRKVRHHHVRAGKNTPFATIGRNGAQGRGGWQQRVGQHQAQAGKHEQGKLQGSLGLVRKRRVFMRNKRADTHHMGLKLFQEHHVLRQAAGRLPRRAHHKAGTHLIANFPQIAKAAFARI